FKLLAQNAMESGDLNHAAIYFGEAKKEFDKACNLLENSDNPESDQIHQQIQKEESELEILYSITELALKYTEIVNFLYAQDTENASKSCLEIEGLLKKIERAGSLPYVYGVSVIYSSAATIVNELVSQEIDNLTVIDRLVSQFQFPLKAMSAALSDVHLEFLGVDDSNPMKSYKELQELDERLSYLEKAIELLPPFLPDKDLKRHKIHAMKYYIKSIIAENKTYIYADNNIVLDLILRARAHYYAKKAEQSIGEIKSKKQEKKLRQLISDRMLKTKTIGIVTESSLVSLGLQSTYKNEVRKYIEEMIRLMAEVEELPDIIGEVAEKQFEEMIDFQEMLDLIMIDTQELIAANIEVTIKGKEINWDFVKRREAFIPAVKSMFEAVKYVILGELNVITKKKAKAESSYLKAGELLYEISSSLGKIAQYLEDQKELPQTVYTISLFCRENSKAIRDRRKTKEVPYGEIISILDYLILNL
ncbi:MAG: hypothetical protein H7645_00895, partial [Candidatus Heimdallarchaeota archaeon]|nr:hypothetical protein [Candidatus Heimdallarchaeota archaeon]MCK4768872.1 hypothetical protein [Candidatus Heimdallarchaeota archaeon]